MINFTNKNSLEELYEDFLEHLIAKGKSRTAIRNFRSPTHKFIKFLKQRDITEVSQITENMLDEFQLWLYQERGLMYFSVVAYMRNVRFFFDFLVKTGKMKRNLLVDRKTMRQPEIPAKQQSHYYTFDEIENRYLNHQSKWVTFNYLTLERKHIKGFIKYLRSNEIKSFYTITEKTLLKYREFLWDEFVHSRKGGLVVRSQKERLCSIVRLLNYLQREGILKENPAKRIEWKQYYREIYQKAKKLKKKVIVNNDLTEMDKYKLEFLEYELAKGKSKGTVQQYRKAVEVFYEYLEKCGISNLAQVNKGLLLNFYYFMNNYKNERGYPITNAHKNKLIWAVKILFRFLVRFDKLAKDPTVDLEPVKEERGLPRDFMNEKEAARIIDQADLSNDPLAIRDRAIMEVFYSTGIRSNGLCSLKIEDIDFQKGWLRINAPKGGADFEHVVAIGTVALEAVNRYLRDSRPIIENGDPKTLFLSFKGHRLTNDSIRNIVKKYSHECRFRKNITPHSFRITCATLMLQNGADIRHVQEQLGHRNIRSTQVYTRLAPKDLKSVHKKCHPRERK